MPLYKHRITSINNDSPFDLVVRALMYIERAEKEMCPILTEKPQKNNDQGKLQLKSTYPYLSILIPRGRKCFLYIKYKYSFLFGCPILNHKPLDRFA